MKYKTLHNRFAWQQRRYTKSFRNDTDDFQGKRLQIFLYLMHYVVNFKKKKTLKKRSKLKKICHHLVKIIPKYVKLRNLL